MEASANCEFFYWLMHVINSICCLLFAIYVFICSVIYIHFYWYINYISIGLLVLGVNKGPLIRLVLKFHLIDTLIIGIMSPNNIARLRF